MFQFTGNCLGKFNLTVTLLSFHHGEEGIIFEGRVRGGARLMLFLHT